MEAFIEHAPMARRVNIWIHTSGFSGPPRVLRIDADGREVIEDLPENEAAAPTFVMPLEWLEAIVAAASNVLPPSAATDRHLKDAVAVRDRLLAMVEKLGAPR